MEFALIPGISILMCCHNSRQRLPFSLQHLQALHIPNGMNVELLVVDNASTDDTLSFAREYVQKHPLPFPVHYLQEPQLGLSFARLTGILAARYEFVLFCDDDNGLYPDYLEQALQCLHQLPEHEAIAMIGGQGIAVFETPPPVWARQFHLFGCGPQAQRSGPVRQLYGAGSLLWKKAFLHLHAAGFRWLLTDRQGERLTSGGDFELCAALQICGYRLWYAENLRFAHFLTATRLSLPYYQRFIREASVSENFFLLYHALPHARGHSRWPVRWLALREAGYHVWRLFTLLLKTFSMHTRPGSRELRRLRIFYHSSRLHHLMHIKRELHNSWPLLVDWYRNLNNHLPQTSPKQRFV